jgi:FKBP-type peptidyl-prolyl cis-trans isomerase (trigger factor)
MQDEVRRRLQGGAKEEDVKSQFEEINKQMSEIAAMQLAAEYILRAIADKEQLTAVFDDIKPQLEEYAASFRRDIAWVQRMFEREGYLPGLYEEARRNKALDLVVANASITVQN